MIKFNNFAKFTKIALSKTLQVNRMGNNPVNNFKILTKNFLHTTTSKKTSVNNSTDRINLKEEFQEMLNETNISEEEVKRKKSEDILKKKETMSEANKEWEKKNENLKKEWEQKSNNNEEEEEMKIGNGFGSKLKNSFRFKKSESAGESDSKDSSKETKGGTGTNGNENKNSKSQSTSSRNGSNGPSVVSRFLTGLGKVWKQTFPGEENLELLLEKRKQEAIILKSKIKEATDEEIAEIEAAIPEWKRGALVLVETDNTPKEKYSIFDIAKRNLAFHIKNLKIYKETQNSLNDSEISLLMKDFKESYSNVKENLKESQNPFFVVSRDLIDRVSFKSPSSQAINIMRKFDPEFDLLVFEKEVDAIFKQLMNAFLRDNLDIVKSLTAEAALAVLSSEIKSRRERNIECKYKELLYIDRADYTAANVIDEDTVILRFRIVCQEINCKISRKDGKVVEGEEDMVMNVHYVIDITRNPTPVIEEVGHPYMIVGLERVGVTRQIL